MSEAINAGIDVINRSNEHSGAYVGTPEFYMGVIADLVADSKSKDLILEQLIEQVERISLEMDAMKLLLGM